MRIGFCDICKKENPAGDHISCIQREIENEIRIGTTLTVTENDLINDLTFVQREGGCPTDLWIPEYGCVLRNGELTEEGLAFAQFMDCGKDKKSTT